VIVKNIRFATGRKGAAVSIAHQEIEKVFFRTPSQLIDMQ